MALKVFLIKKVKLEKKKEKKSCEIAQILPELGTIFLHICS